MLVKELEDAARKEIAEEKEKFVKDFLKSYLNNIEQWDLKLQSLKKRYNSLLNKGMDELFLEAKETGFQRDHN
jgi:hypothetical protein